MPMAEIKFSKRTLEFLKKAPRQKRQDWLDRNAAEYDSSVRLPLLNLARHLKSALAHSAPNYRFPQKGIGRLKKNALRAKESGQLYKNWISYSASVPSESRFEANPNLYFMIDLNDPDDTILVAGGLYVPSSRQVRALREAIAADATAFDELFADPDFKQRFPGGFSKDRISSRNTRGFDPCHPRMEWLRLQAFFVWRRYTIREFVSPRFAELVERDWRQILRLNHLLDRAIAGRLPVAEQGDTKLLSSLESIERFDRVMDF